jgi:hypothetical protein
VGGVPPEPKKKIRPLVLDFGPASPLSTVVLASIVVGHCISFSIA